MDTIFKNSENSKICDPHRSLLNLTDKTNLKRSGKYVDLWSLSILLYLKNNKNRYKSNQVKISTPMWDNKFELSDESYSV